MGADPERPAGFEQPRVDPGALALATVAGAVAFIFGPGEWDLLGVVIGLVLMCVLLAHHVAAPAEPSPRSLLLRAAFGATTGLAFCIATAPAIQHFVITPYFHGEDEEGFSLDPWHTTVTLSVMWFFVAALLAVLEPRIARWLDASYRRDRTI